MRRHKERFRDDLAKYVPFFAEREKASIDDLRTEASLGYENALRVILDLLELGYIRRLDDSTEEDLNEYCYGLTYKGLKHYLMHRQKEDGKLGEVSRIHSGKSVVLRHYDVFKASGLGDYILKRFQSRYRYRVPRGYLESIRYFLKPDNDVVDAVDVLGLDYLTMDVGKVKKMLGEDFEMQLRLFQVLGQIPELASIQQKYLTYVEDRAKHVIDNIHSWKIHIISSQRC